MCMFGLSAFVQKYNALGVCKEIIFRNRPPEITNILFVDDIIVFVEASLDNIKTFSLFLNSFVMDSENE